MAEIQLGAVEARFADIIWEREPVTSTELIKLAAAKLTWKRTTTHTVLRRLCDKGLFQNNLCGVSPRFPCRVYQRKEADSRGNCRDS